MGRSDIKRTLVGVLRGNPVRKTDVLADSHFIDSEIWEISELHGDIIWKRTTDHESVTLRWDELRYMEIVMLLDVLYGERIIGFDGSALDE